MSKRPKPTLIRLSSIVHAKGATWYVVLLVINEYYTQIPERTDIAVAQARPVKFHDVRCWEKTCRGIPVVTGSRRKKPRGGGLPREVFPWWSVSTY